MCVKQGNYASDCIKLKCNAYIVKKGMPNKERKIIKRNSVHRSIWMYIVYLKFVLNQYIHCKVLIDWLYIFFLFFLPCVFKARFFFSLSLFVSVWCPVWCSSTACCLFWIRIKWSVNLFLDCELSQLSPVHITVEFGLASRPLVGGCEHSCFERAPKLNLFIFKW